MKKQLATLVLAISATSTGFAQIMIMGDIVQKEELIIVNGNISCSAYSLKDEDLKDSSKIVFAEYDMAVQRGKNFSISGTVAGNSFNIHGNTEAESLNVSWSEKSDVKPGELSPNRSSASGSFKNETSGVNLIASSKGQTTSVGCTRFIK